MSRFLLIALVFGVLMMMWRRRHPTPSTRPPRTETMHACGRCGVHVPVSLCVWRDGKPYCCADHARQG